MRCMLVRSASVIPTYDGFRVPLPQTNAMLLCCFRRVRSRLDGSLSFRRCCRCFFIHSVIRQLLWMSTRCSLDIDATSVLFRRGLSLLLTCFIRRRSTSSHVNSISDIDRRNRNIQVVVRKRLIGSAVVLLQSLLSALDHITR